MLYVVYAAIPPEVNETVSPNDETKASNVQKEKTESPLNRSNQTMSPIDQDGETRTESPSDQGGETGTESPSDQGSDKGNQIQSPLQKDVTDKGN